MAQSLVARVVIYAGNIDIYEKRNSLSTGEPENSGFNRIQLRSGISLSIPNSLRSGRDLYVLEEILQASPPLLQEPRPVIRNQTLGWQLRDRRLEIGKSANQPPPEVVKLGVPLPYIHVAPLSQKNY